MRWPGSTYAVLFATRDSDADGLAQDLWSKMMRSVGGGFLRLPE